MRRYLLIVLGIVLVTPLFLAAGKGISAGEEDWSIIKIAGVPVGYIMEIQAKSPDGHIFLTSDSKITLNRLGNKVELETRTRTEETAEGRLLRSESELRASVMSTKSVTIVKSGILEIETEAGGKKYTRTVPYAGDLLGPEGIRLLSVEKLHAPGDKVEFLTLSAESGAAAKGSRKVLAREDIMVLGRTVSTLKVEEVIEPTGIAGSSWLDKNGDTVRGEMPTPFGLSEIIPADRDSALSAAGGGELPAEMYERSIIKTNVRLTRARALEMLKVRLILREPGTGWPELSRPGQTVISKSDNEIVLEMRRLPVPPAAKRPAVETAKSSEYLRPNEYIQSDLPELKKIALSVVGDETDVLKSGLKLERWVADNMTFDLGIALAPASELIKNKRGTCVGYATLLATLSRAVGIPSRVVLGYVYALGMFGGHAWAEILIGEEWVPLDAAIVSSGIADPARIGFSASSLESGALSLTGGAAARLFGGIDIKILSYRLNGWTSDEPEASAPFRIDGDTYLNPGLGIAWRKLAGFAFTGTDLVWPNTTIAILQGPDNARVTFQERTRPPWKQFSAAAETLFSDYRVSGPSVRVKVGSLSGLRRDGSDQAVIVCDNDPDIWIFVAEGKKAADLLTEAMRGFIIARK